MSDLKGASSVKFCGENVLSNVLPFYIRLLNAAREHAYREDTCFLCGFSFDGDWVVEPSEAPNERVWMTPTRSWEKGEEGSRRLVAVVISLQ